MKVSFVIDGDFINDQVRQLVEEGKLAHAFRMAESCLMSDEITDEMRIGLAFAVLAGAKHIASAENDDGIVLLDANEPTDVPLHAYVSDMLKGFEDRIQTAEASAARMQRKLDCIFESCVDSYPNALRHACIEYMHWPDADEGYLFSDEVTIPEAICESYSEHPSSQALHLDDGLSGCAKAFGKDDPLTQFVDMHQEEDPEYTYGWLDPEGVFHPSPWGHHEGWAAHYLEENAIAYDESSFNLHAAGDELSKLGWVLIHNPMHGIGHCTVNVGRKLTLPQKDFLEKYYKHHGQILAADAARKGYMEEVDEFFDCISFD